MGSLTAVLDQRTDNVSHAQQLRVLCMTLSERKNSVLLWQQFLPCTISKVREANKNTISWIVVPDQRQ